MLMRMYIPVVSEVGSIRTSEHWQQLDKKRQDVLGAAVGAVIEAYGHARTWTYQIQIPKTVPSGQKPAFMLVPATVVETNGKDIASFDKVKPTKVYNLTTVPTHTYSVITEEGDLLVHNNGDGGGGDGEVGHLGAGGDGPDFRILSQVPDQSGFVQRSHFILDSPREGESLGHCGERCFFQSFFTSRPARRITLFMHSPSKVRPKRLGKTKIM